MTEREKMLKGLLYDPSDPDLEQSRVRAHTLCFQFNQTPETDPEKRRVLLRELLPNADETFAMTGPVQIDYGTYVYTGKRCYANFNLVILDVCPVTLGDDIFLGSSVSLLTPLHPFFPDERRYHKTPDGRFSNLEYGKPITIGSDCWLASNVTVCGGVTIGRGCIIGAGSVVTHDIPPFSLAAGNPCSVIRAITDADRMLPLS